MYNDQNGLQFRNSGHNKAVGILLIVLGSVMGLSILGACIGSFADGEILVIAGILISVALCGGMIAGGCLLLNKSSASDRRIQEVYRKYNIAGLQQEINYFTIASHVNPYNGGLVYFTERFIIATSEGVFAYNEIKEISAYKSTSKYGLTDNYLRIVLHSGDKVVLCHSRGTDPALKAQMVEYVNICVLKNRSLQADVKDLF